MSLKFGIYLVEQRIISPEQFCGLVKIQLETGASLATVALRKNLMTIKQVATVLDQLDMNPNKTFVQIAIEADLLDQNDAELLIREQHQTLPSIKKLVQECGLLTERQCNVLYQHFQRHGTRPMTQKPEMSDEQLQSMPSQTTQPAMSVPNAGIMNETVGAASERGPRAPKFKQRPVIVSQYTSPASS